MIKQNVRRNILLVVTLFLFCNSRANPTNNRYEYVEFATNVSTFEIWSDDEILLGDNSGHLVLFNMTNGKQTSLYSKEIQVTSITKIPGKERAIVTFADGTVVLFNCNHSSLSYEKILNSEESILNNYSMVNSINISSDGKKALFCRDLFFEKRGLVEVWDLEEERIIFKFCTDFLPGAIVFSSDNSWVIAGDSDGIITWYRLSDGYAAYSINSGLMHITNIYTQDLHLFVVTSDATFSSVDPSKSYSLFKKTRIGLDQVDTIIPLQVDGQENFIGSCSKNMVFLLNKMSQFIIKCPTLRAIKKIKILQQRKPIVLLEDGTLIGYLFDFLLQEKKQELDKEQDTFTQRFSEFCL